VRHGGRPSDRRPTGLSRAVAFCLLALQAAALLHIVALPHRFCAEHGDWEDDEVAAAPASRSSDVGPSMDAEASLEARGEHGCFAARLLRCGAAPRPWPAALVSMASAPEPAAPARIPVKGLDVLAYAPKVSPPES
jgi:hypothetical protein